jgi:hypothetical protein
MAERDGNRDREQAPESRPAGTPRRRPEAGSIRRRLGTAATVAVVALLAVSVTSVALSSRKTDEVRIAPTAETSGVTDPSAPTDLPTDLPGDADLPGSTGDSTAPGDDVATGPGSSTPGTRRDAGSSSRDAQSGRTQGARVLSAAALELCGSLERGDVLGALGMGPTDTYEVVEAGASITKLRGMGFRVLNSCAIQTKGPFGPAMSTNTLSVAALQGGDLVAAIAPRGLRVQDVAVGDRAALVWTSLGVEYVSAAAVQLDDEWVLLTVDLQPTGAPAGVTPAAEAEDPETVTAKGRERAATGAEAIIRLLAGLPARLGR